MIIINSESRVTTPMMIVHSSSTSIEADFQQGNSDGSVEVKNDTVDSGELKAHWNGNGYKLNDVKSTRAVRQFPQPGETGHLLSPLEKAPSSPPASAPAKFTRQHESPSLDSPSRISKLFKTDSSRNQISLNSSTSASLKSKRFPAPPFTRSGPKIATTGYRLEKYFPTKPSAPPMALQ